MADGDRSNWHIQSRPLAEPVPEFRFVVNFVVEIVVSFDTYVPMSADSIRRHRYIGIAC